MLEDEVRDHRQRKFRTAAFFGVGRCAGAFERMASLAHFFPQLYPLEAEDLIHAEGCSFLIVLEFVAVGGVVCDVAVP